MSKAATMVRRKITTPRYFRAVQLVRAEKQNHRFEIQRLDEGGTWSDVALPGPRWRYGEPIEVAGIALEEWIRRVGDLPGGAADKIRVQVWEGNRPRTFALSQVLRWQLQAAAKRREKAEEELAEAREKLRSAVLRAAAVGISQADIARSSGWSRETIRKLTT